MTERGGIPVWIRNKRLLDREHQKEVEAVLVHHEIRAQHLFIPFFLIFSQINDVTLMMAIKGS